MNVAVLSKRNIPQTNSVIHTVLSSISAKP